MTPSSLARHTLVIILVISLLSATGSCSSIRVGTKTSSPLSMKDSNGIWVGFNWDMLDWMISNKKIEYQNETVTNYTVIDAYTSNSAGFQALTDDKFDIWLASPTKTASREAIVDFSHTFFKTGFKILVHTSISAGTAVQLWFSHVFTPQVTFFIVLTLVILIGVAELVWMLEMLDTKQERKYFTPNIVGFFQALAWAINTVLSSSYAKKPRHPISRGFGTVLGRSNLIVTALITALFTAATITQPPTGINGKSDLAGHLVAVVPGTTAAKWVQDQGDIPTLQYATTTAAFEGFKKKEVEVFIYDAPRLIWWTKEQAAAGNTSYAVVGELFEAQDYGIATAENSPELLEQFDQSVLAFVNDPVYDTFFHRWFSLQKANTTTAAFKWEIAHIVSLSVTPVVVVLIAVLVRVFAIKKGASKVTLRGLDQEMKLQQMQNVENADLGFLLTRMINNQALMLRYSYLLTHRDRFFVDQPITREEIDSVVDRVQQAGEDFLYRVTQYEMPQQRTTTVTETPPSGAGIMSRLGRRGEQKEAEPESSGVTLQAFSIAGGARAYKVCVTHCVVGGGFTRVQSERQRPTVAITGPEEQVAVSVDEVRVEEEDGETEAF